MDKTVVAIWIGSLGATVVLGTFMLVQAVMDPPRRRRYAFFSAVMWAIAALDFLRPQMDLRMYELFRLFPWSAYAAAVLLLLNFPRRWVVSAALGLPAIGLAIWWWVDPALATTAAFPLAFMVAAFAHDRQYSRERGYATAVLRAYSVAMALACSIYYTGMSTGNSRIILLGYAHWVVLYIAAVLFGWVHLPRELRGRAPVRVEPPAAAALFVSVVLAEMGVILGMLAFFTWPPEVYLVSSVVMLGATLVLYYHHRHRLVIHTDNVSALLEERTASLRHVQEQLARQNEIQAQKLRDQARELQAKSEVIDRQRRLELAAQTAGQAAHDIQNLISPIMVYVAQLQREDGLSESARVAVTVIRNQLQHLLDLNGQLLTLSRRGRVETGPVCLNELLDDLRARFPGKRLDLQSDGEVWVEGSWAQLSRAVSNLITNALEADSEHPVRVWCGTVEIPETRRCHLGFLGPGRYATIDVRDSGPGIPEEIREKIFEPFFSTKRGESRSGSGLGLSIVTAVVDDHHGVLDMKSGPEGTCFALFFPAITAPMAEPEPREVSQTATVVVADDDTSILQRYGKILEEAGYIVHTARNGHEAIDILRDEHVDIMLLDLKMPRMSGLETYFGALNLRPGIRVVVHSSYVTGDEARRLRALGADAFLQKPAGRSEVLRTLRQVLAGQSLPLPFEAAS